MLVEDPAAVDLVSFGARAEAAFPAGANVHVVAVRDGGLDLRVWERGVGLTDACGSGATAAAAVANGWGLVGPTVEVRMPGGTAVVEVDGTSAALTGPTVFVAEVVVP